MKPNLKLLLANIIYATTEHLDFFHLDDKVLCFKLCCTEEESKQNFMQMKCWRNWNENINWNKH